MRSLKGGIYWVIAQVKDISSEILDIAEADMVYLMESRMCSCDKVATIVLSESQTTTRYKMNLSEPGRSIVFLRKLVF